ncbi:MAG: hypothetical protein IPI43_11330 [Sandaracinaceae bacterium]|nr:hypothetical protein [Sandaracinaceae bacterium]
MNLCAQRETFVFATCFTVWNQSGFAKLNLPDHAWAGGAASRERFLTEFAPQLVTADPLTLASMLELDVPVRPRAIFSSALMLDPAHAAAAAAHFDCPVIDFYGATEVGPIAAKLPGAPGHVLLLPDLFVEVLDEDGLPLPDGEVGELTFTGGRNPYLPLVRYRSSDRGALGTCTLADGRKARVILGLEGREAVHFRARNGSLVNSVDVGRALRDVGPFVQHEVHQRADHSGRAAEPGSVHPLVRRGHAPRHGARVRTGHRGACRSGARLWPRWKTTHVFLGIELALLKALQFAAWRASLSLSSKRSSRSWSC